jgi:hypothetical protein
LGAKKHVTEFILEDAIKDAVEIGYDGFVIDGKFAETALVGIEVKDHGYVGWTGLYSDIPEPVRMVNERLAPYFKNVGYRGFFSSELRVTPDNTPYMIDPCARMGAPPGYLQMILIENLADILWHGSEGTVVNPEYKAKWGTEIIIGSNWVEHNWQAIQFPEKIRENVKLRYCTRIKDKYYVLPQLGTGQNIAADGVAYGNTRKEAIDNCKKVVDQVKGYYLEPSSGALDEAEEECDQLNRWLGKSESDKAESPDKASQRELAKILRGALKGNKTLSETLSEALEG